MGKAKKIMGAVSETAPISTTETEIPISGKVWITGITFKGDHHVSVQLANRLIKKNAAKLKKI